MRLPIKKTTLDMSGFDLRAYGDKHSRGNHSFLDGMYSGANITILYVKNDVTVEVIRYDYGIVFGGLNDILVK